MASSSAIGLEQPSSTELRFLEGELRNRRSGQRTFLDDEGAGNSNYQSLSHRFMNGGTSEFSSTTEEEDADGIEDIEPFTLWSLLSPRFYLSVIWNTIH